MKTSLRSHKALLKWSFLRHRYLFVSFTVLQIMFALAIVYGLTLMLDMSGGQSAQNVNTGVWQLCLITIGCNLAPQMMAGSISEGFMEYQSNLPVSRVGILLSDWLIWALVSAPGVAAAILAGWARFGLVPPESRAADTPSAAVYAGQPFFWLYNGFMVPSGYCDNSRPGRYVCCYAVLPDTVFVG